MSSTQKIGTSEWITIRSHGNRMYLPLKKDLTNAFDLKRGDLLLIKVEKVQRKKSLEEN